MRLDCLIDSNKILPQGKRNPDYILLETLIHRLIRDINFLGGWISCLIYNKLQPQGNGNPDKILSESLIERRHL